MSADRDQLQRRLIQLQTELDEQTNVNPEFRQHLESTLAELHELLGEPDPPTQQHSLVQTLTESARHFEETHPNLAGMIGSVIDALARMGI